MSEQIYQFFIILLICCWIIPLVLIWVRFDRFPHAKPLFAAILTLPCLLIDNLVMVLEIEAPYILGAFDFSPILMTILLFLSIRKLTIEKKQPAPFIHFIPVVLLCVGQLPFLAMTVDIKIMMNNTSPNGQLAQYWPWYAFHSLLCLTLLVYALRIEQMLNNYQQHLSDQVVDVNFYKMGSSTKLFAGLITLAFAGIVLILAIAFGFLQFSKWLLTFDVIYYLLFFVLIMVLLEKRRYSPSPLDYKKLKEHGFSQEKMQDALQAAGEAIIENKLYKVVGLRLRHVADKAKIDPQLLAVSSRELINRNFRAYIYHYRLEYAKNILMRTDAKVSAVAKRLGFTSEKFLSDMFIKYVEMMGKQQPDTDEEEKHLFG